MADFLSIKTLESDEECDYSDESDVEVNKKNEKRKFKKKKTQTTDFDNEFNFNDGGAAISDSWNVDKDMKNRAKGQIKSEILEQQIIKKRKEIKKKETKKNKKNNITAEQLEAEEEKDKDLENHELDEEDNILSSDFDDDDDDADSDDEQPFFTLPPPQVKHKSFAQMNLSRPLLKALNDLNFTHPTKIQSSSIPLALLGKDICACATTGSGKTAAFMLPILERLIFKPKETSVSRVLVLVPTRELAIQVHEVSKSLSKYTKVQLCLATGGLDSKVQEALLRRNPDIIIATPGRLIDHLHNTPSFDLQTIEILVLDEADRMLEEHFKDQMKELIKSCARGRQTMLFSATMTEEVEELISLSLNKPTKLFISQNTDVAANLHQEFIRIRSTKENDRISIVVAMCVRSFTEHTLVFLQTKRLAHKLRIVLGLLGLKVAELHGDLTQLQRLEALEKFKLHEVDILVATDLAARGLDISGVKTVISFNMPTTLKSYIHRVGRTARAGKAGRSITLVGEKERKLLKELVKTAKMPVKNRIISSDVIDKYRKKVEELEKDIKDIMKGEEEEKELRVAEMQMNKARNLIEHRDEIKSRPIKTFIKTIKPKDTKQKKVKTLTDEEKKIQKIQEFQSRQMKRERRPKRIRAFDETADSKPRKGPKQVKMLPSKKSFDRELTDTSRRNLKSMRSESFVPKKKKTGGTFKSKSKHRRR